MFPAAPRPITSEVHLPHSSTFAHSGASLSRLPPERPLTPEYQKIDAEQKAAAAKLAEGAEACKWPGAVTLMTYPYPFEILQNKGKPRFVELPVTIE